MNFNAILLKGLPFLLLLGGVRWLTLPEPTSQPEVNTEANQSSALSPAKSKGNQQEFFSYENTCPVHLPHGMPTGTAATNDFIVRDIYCLSSNDTTKFADFVAYKLDKATITGSSEQDRDWQADPAIAPSETLEPDDYRGAYEWGNYDRGHLAPLANFRGKNWQQVNYLSNIAPQKASLNRGAWKELEDHERDLARQYHKVFVITGTAYNSQQKIKLINADENNIIPAYFWKVIYYNGKVESYIFPQDTPSGTDYKLGQTQLSEIKAYSHFDFSFLSGYQEIYPNETPF